MVGVWLEEMKFLKIKDKHLCEYSSKPGGLQGWKKITEMSTSFKKSRKCFYFTMLLSQCQFIQQVCFSLVLWDL